jgi:hypothetical protein
MDSRSIAIVVLVGVCILIVARWSMDHFRILGSAYRLSDGGSRSETQDECLQNPSYRACMMTDGTPGVCMLSGQCTPDIMVDLRTVRDQLDIPYCTAPTFKTGCGRMCKCLNQRDGRDIAVCKKDCEAWFSPL